MTTDAKRANWFPKPTSVAIEILGYVCEGDGKYTLEDIVWHTGCNAATAVGNLYILRRAGYIAVRREGNRIQSDRNPKWGRNALHATRRGRERFAKHEEELRKARDKDELK